VSRLNQHSKNDDLGWFAINLTVIIMTNKPLLSFICSFNTSRKKVKLEGKNFYWLKIFS